MKSFLKYLLKIIFLFKFHKGMQSFNRTIIPAIFRYWADFTFWPSGNAYGSSMRNYLM